MRNLLLGLVTLSSLSSAYAIDLPVPKAGTSICYSRHYSKAEQKNNQLVKDVHLQISVYKEYTDQISNLITITDKTNKKWLNGGGIFKQSGSVFEGYGDCDSGQWKLIQDQKDRNKVRLEVDYLELVKANSDDEGCSEISLPKKDKVMILYRDTQNCTHTEPAAQ